MGKVSKLTNTDDTHEATRLAGILMVADSWARIPRKRADGKVVTVEIAQAEVRELLLEMQEDGEEENESE